MRTSFTRSSFISSRDPTPTYFDLRDPCPPPVVQTNILSTPDGSTTAKGFISVPCIVVVIRNSRHLPDQISRPLNPPNLCSPRSRSLRWKGRDKKQPIPHNLPVTPYSTPVWASVPGEMTPPHPSSEYTRIRRSTIPTYHSTIALFLRNRRATQTSA